MSEWATCEVADSFVKTRVGRKHQIPAKDVTQAGEFPVVDQGQEFISGYCDDAQKLIDFHLPLIIFGDHTRCFKFVDFPFVLGADGTKVLAPNKTLYDPKFYYFALLALELPSRGYNRHFKMLKERSLPLPPLPEQKKIAHILSTVQRAIEAQERIIQTTTELKKALMRKLFTEGLRNEPQKQTEIGLVPESWQVVELESTGEVVYGIQASVANNIVPIGTRILTNKNITLDGGFNFEKINYFELTTKRHRATILQQGDILFNWRSGSKYHVGKTAYFDLEGEWVHSSFILRIRPNPEINGRFLFYYFNHLREDEYFVKLQTYAINAKFNKSAVNALPTVVPSRDKQDEVASVLDTAQKKIDSANRRLATLQTLFHTFLHELMTAKTRVHELSIPKTKS